MKIKVQFASLLREVTGTGEIWLEFSGTTVKEAMDELWRLYPGLKEELLDEEGNLDYLYSFILNGSRLTWPHVQNERLQDGDRLTIMAFLAGG